jgi:hypothetical protein
MKDLLNKILVAAAGVLLAITLAAVALAAGGGALSEAARGSVDAPLLALVAGVLAAGVARGIRSARAAAGGATARRAPRAATLGL